MPIKVWPGTPLSPRRNLDRSRRQFRHLQRERHGRGRVPLRQRRFADRKRPRTHDRVHRPGVARFPAGNSSPASTTASACTALTNPKRDCASMPPSCSSTRIPRPSAATSNGARKCTPTRWAARTPISPRPPRRLRGHAQEHRRRPHLRLGRRRTAAHPAAPLDHLRGARQGLHQAQPERAREDPRHLRGHGQRGSHQLPQGTGHHRRRVAAHPPTRRGPAPRRERTSKITGVTTPSVISRRTIPTPPPSRGRTW